MIVWLLDLQLPVRVQSVTITTKVTSLNPAHSVVYSLQHYVINFNQSFETGRWFSPGTLVSSTNKIDRHNITDILLKMTLNTITLIHSTINVDDTVTV